jgi:hypothetical protein
MRFLQVYAGLLTGVVAFLALCGFGRDTTKFQEIDVQRINLVEPDGTLRMVISDKTRFPGVIIKGHEQPHPDRETAGMLFFNDEGTENGGLIFGGSKDAVGHESNYGHLSFDEYEQDQVMALEVNQGLGQHESGLELSDNPNYPIGDLLAEISREKELSASERDKAMKQFIAAKGTRHSRLYLGRDEDGSVDLKMKDAKGRTRILIGVGPDGEPRIQVLNAAGKVVKRVL